jgi:hypothetical protein
LGGRKSHEVLDMFISIITCTFNPDVAVLRRVMKALDEQTLDKASWEYVVVDNGSDQPVEGRVDVRWHPQARIVCEPQKGLTRARLKGMAECRGDVLVFVDDDNILAKDYLASAVELLAKYPFVGVLGGVTRGEFKVEVAEWMKDFLFVFGVTEGLYGAGCPEIQFALARKLGPWMPIGAGMIVRRNVAEYYRDVVSHDAARAAFDRTGLGSIAGGGDTDLICTSMDRGMACAVSSKLSLTHVIPAWRLDPVYLTRLLYSSNYGVARILLAHGWVKAASPEKLSVTARVRNALLKFSPRTAEQKCWRAFQKGYADALGGNPYDSSYH